MTDDGALETKSHMERLVCHDCAVEPQRRQVDPDEQAGRRAGANWPAHREAWAGREHERRSQTPLTPGARELRQADWSGCERA